MAKEGEDDGAVQDRGQPAARLGKGKTQSMVDIQQAKGKDKMQSRRLASAVTGVGSVGVASAPG